MFDVIECILYIETHNAIPPKDIKDENNQLIKKLFDHFNIFLGKIQMFFGLHRQIFLLRNRGLKKGQELHSWLLKFLIISNASLLTGEVSLFFFPLYYFLFQFE